MWAKSSFFNAALILSASFIDAPPSMRMATSVCSLWPSQRALTSSDFGDAFDVLRCMADFRDKTGFNAVEHPRQHRFCRLPDDDEDRNGDQKADDRVGQWKSEPDANGTSNDREARKPICAGMIAIGNECGAVDFPANADAEHRHGFVADEADQAGKRHPNQRADGLGMQDTVNSFVTSDERAEQDDERRW